MEPQQQKSNADTEVRISLSEATIRSCSLDDGTLNVTLANSLRLQFSPTEPGVKRYLHVAEYGPRGHAPDDFVERVELLLREGLLGVPKLIDLGGEYQAGPG